MKDYQNLNSDSLQSDEANNTQRLLEGAKGRKNRIIGFALIIAILAVFTVTGLLLLTRQKDIDNSVNPVKLRLALPPQDPFPIILGESRVIQVLLYSGFDDRSADDFKNVNQREVQWSSQPEGIISMDQYGRIQAVRQGVTKIKVVSKRNSSVQAERTIKVVTHIDATNPAKRIISYEGQPANLNNVLQKFVSYKSKEEAMASAEVPETIKKLILDPTLVPKKQVTQQNGAVWTIQSFADGSNRSFVKRVYSKEADVRDKIMFLVGNRYMPGNGLEALSIEDDESLGIWVVNSKGEVSHIEMKQLGYREKAELMVEDTQKYIIRYGFASSSTLKNGHWASDITDNDGLWTGMYAAGEIMKLSSLRTRAFPDDQIAKARDSALASLKAVLLLANIACRNTTVNAKIRHLVNTVNRGEILNSQFLKEGRALAVDEYVGSPVDEIGLFGVDAGHGDYGGKFKYSYFPIIQGDWSNNSVADVSAKSKRTLNGFIARNIMIEPLEGTPAASGLYFRHNRNGTQTVLSSADKLYDYTKDDHPVLDLGQMDLPQILKDFLNINGVQYDKFDLLYKGDTSTDSIIAHFFLYKIAFDILDESDQEEKTLKDLIRSTMVNFCTCLTNNGYTMVDATGQGTVWAKLTRAFMNSDSTFQDAPLKAFELLMSFKLCYYLTGDIRWYKQYQFLVQDASFRYLQLVASVWKRWRYIAFNADVPQASILRLNSSKDYSELEIERHIIIGVHVSDEEEAMLAFYLAFQLEDNQKYLQLYREGLEGWWHSISRSQNPLWYYIYQLAYPHQQRTDHYGNSLIDTTSWQLSRHSVDTRTTTAFIQGCRSDAILQGKPRHTISTDPNKILQKRQQETDSKFYERDINYKIAKGYNPMNIYEIKVLPADERSIHKFNSGTFHNIDEGNPNSMQAATIYTLPYWMGVYHNMLKFQ